MGTTIHTHIEYKTDNGNWLHWAAPVVSANYKLFALITGVRNDNYNIKPIVGERGLPKDISEATKIAYEQDSRAYSSLRPETWLNGDEIVKLQERWVELTGGKPTLDNDLEYSVFHTYGPGGSAIASHQGFADVRIIFWFDD